MTAQLPLFPRRATKAALANDRERLVNYLAFGSDWRTRREIARDLGIDSRRVRLIRQMSKGTIIMGQRGFKLASRATPDEIAHAANQLESQAREMVAEAIDLRNSTHRRIAA